MPLPPALLKASADALKIALEPSAKRVGAGLLALVEAGLRGEYKSPEERLLDLVEGEIARDDRRRTAIERLRAMASDPDMEHQRILARAAAEAVRGDFVMPALEIAGPILRDSEFESPGTPIWEMWKELLARACDSSRLDEAHPAYMEVIKQLSGDEAKLLTAIEPWRGFATPGRGLRGLSVDRFNLTFPKKLFFYNQHLTTLGLTDMVTLADGTNTVLIEDEIFRSLTTFGYGFMTAVSSPHEPTPVSPTPP